MNESDELQAAYHVVCMIDVLGQRNKLAGWRDLVVTRPLNPETITAIKSTVGTILAFKKQFRNFFSKVGGSENPNWLGTLPPEKQAIYHRSKDSKLDIQQFSDTFVFYAPLPNTYGDASIVPVYRMLGACSLAMLVSIAGKTPVRGSITIGAGVELEERNFYGPALVKVHDLEKQVADWPRVVVSDTVIEFISQGQTYSGNVDINRIMQLAAGHCRSLVTQDCDRQWIVDYVGEGVHNMVGQETAYPVCVQKAYDFVVQEERRFTEERDDKLAPRYKHVREYLESRLSIWGIDP